MGELFHIDSRVHKRNLSFNKKAQVTSSSDDNIYQDEIQYNKQTVPNLSGRIESAYGQEGGNKMDDYLKHVLEKMDKDASEREARYHNDAREREARYREEMLEQDRRYREEAREREERMIKLVSDIKTDLKSDIADLKTEVRAINKDTRNISITTIIGIAAMTLTVVGLVITIILSQSSSTTQNNLPTSVNESTQAP